MNFRVIIGYLKRMHLHKVLLRLEGFSPSVIGWLLSAAFAVVRGDMGGAVATVSGKHGLSDRRPLPADKTTIFYIRIYYLKSLA